MKEIVSLHIGQAGNQIGFALWELYLAEHGLSRDGYLVGEVSEDEFVPDALFKICHKGNYIPRGLFIDMEPTIISQLKTGSYRKLFHPDQLINSSDDSGCNFARAFYTQGRLIYATLLNELRKQVEESDSIEAILIHRSLSGGSGAGLTAICIEILQEYTKINRIELAVNPSPNFNSCIVAPYNSILGEHFSMDEIDVGFMIDNESLLEASLNQLHIKSPTMTSINRIIAQVCSAMTASTRFRNQLLNDFNVVMTNLVPYPRIHFPVVSYAPLGSDSNTEHEELSVFELTGSVFQKENQLIQCDLKTGRLMCCSLVYRGHVSVHGVNTALSMVKLNRSIPFVDWCPTGFKVGIVDQPPTIIPDSYLSAKIDKNVIMMSNSSVVSSTWQRLSQKFHRLYSKRSFVHWFVAENLEESEFSDALYNIASLAKDYEEVSVDSSFLNVVATEDVSSDLELLDSKLLEEQVLSEESESDDESNDNHCNNSRSRCYHIPLYQQHSQGPNGSVTCLPFNSTSIISQSPALMRSVTTLSDMIHQSSFSQLLHSQSHDTDNSIAHSRQLLSKQPIQSNQSETDHTTLLNHLISQTSQQYDSRINF